MFKSSIIVTELAIQITDYEYFGFDYIDLRDKTIYELYKILPTLMYNHLIILKLDESITSYLNTYNIAFTEVYQQDSESDLYSSTLGYMNNKIRLKDIVLKYEDFHKYIIESIRNSWTSGWNACRDYIRKEKRLNESNN